MKIIGNSKELATLDRNLVEFIKTSSPWLLEAGYDPTRIGYIFILDDDDINKTDSVCIVPHIPDNTKNRAYREEMTINLATFDAWEFPPEFDEVSGYWYAVAVPGQEYGCAIFLSAAYAEFITPPGIRYNKL